MGQFSWLDCVTEEQILDDVVKDVYVLVPKEFGGGHIKETCYDGYGNFGGYDIYDLVADWNREYLSKHPEFEFEHAKKRLEYVKKYQNAHPDYTEKICVKVSDYEWYKDYADLDKTREEIAKNLRWGEYRTLGIDIACYDEDNAALPYPIKITYNKNAVYEHCSPSPSDPNQGWEVHEDEYEEEDDWY